MVKPTQAASFSNAEAVQNPRRHSQLLNYTIVMIISSIKLAMVVTKRGKGCFPGGCLLGMAAVLAAIVFGVKINPFQEREYLFKYIVKFWDQFLNESLFKCEILREKRAKNLCLCSISRR